MTMRRTMRRTVATLAVAALTVTACSGGDDDAEPAAEEPAAEEPAEEPAAEESPAEEPADNGSSDDEPAAEPADDSSDDEPDAEPADDSGDDEPAEEPAADEEEPEAEPASDGDTIVARSLGDVPQRCRDQMAAFMRELEPIVEDVDWSSATINDLEQLGNDLEAASTTFDTESAAIGCDDIDFPDDNEFELLIEFARTEAPGVVGYFEFLDGLGVGDTASDDDDEATMELPVIGDDFADCDEAIAFVEGLIDQYDSGADVPAAELMKIAGISAVFGTCTPEQFAFFDDPEVQEFFAGL